MQNKRLPVTSSRSGFMSRTRAVDDNEAIFVFIRFRSFLFFLPGAGIRPFGRGKPGVPFVFLSRFFFI